MQWLEDMQAHIQKMKEANYESQSYCLIHLDMLENDDEEKRVDTMIRVLKYYQQKMEEELRKPHKSWNYPASWTSDEDCTIALSVYLTYSIDIAQYIILIMVPHP